MNALAIAAVDDGQVGVVRNVMDARADAAFGRELASLRTGMMRHAMRLCHCPTESEDLVSETMLRAWAARRSFDPDSNMAAWTTFILRNAFLSRMRRSKFSGGSVEDLPISLLPSGGPAQYAAMDLADAFRAMRELPRDQRIAVELVGSGATYEEAAEETCVSVGTVKSRVARGRDGLRELLA